MKKILGLDLGTNSIGWAIVEKDDNSGSILKSGSRIIPMDAATLGDFAMGNTKSQTSERTQMRSARRMRERFLLRRERLHRILNILGYLPKYYSDCIGWDIENDMKHYGTFLEGMEPKLAWNHNSDKPEFLFVDSFSEMVNEFKAVHPELFEEKSSGKTKTIPYDWTLYYLRKKALSQPISNEELAWIILNFNQKRGYNQLRDEDFESSDDKKQEYVRLKVKEVIEQEPDKKNGHWYEIHFEDSDIVYRRTSKRPLSWVGKDRDLIITTKLDENGNPKIKKDGSIDYSIKSPEENDWGLMKIRTEAELQKTQMTVGQYIYSALLANPSEKIKGGLVRTIERDNYKEELKLILTKQAEFHDELRNRELYEKCIKDLYKNNDTHRNNIAKNDFTFLILEDVLFYQRPLKSKKSLIDECPYESHQGIDKTTGEIITYYNKCIAKSNPYFQEYRVWKFLSDLKIIASTKEVDGKMCSDVDVTDEFIKSQDEWCLLFTWLNDKGTIDQKSLLTHLGIKKNEIGNYRWNFVADKTYPLNATRHSILAKLEKGEALTRELEQSLWHLLYSVSTKTEIDKALSPDNKGGLYTRIIEAGISNKSIEKIKKIKFEDDGYGAYSEKAIKKLLAVMRRGKLWNKDAIDRNTLLRIKGFISNTGLDEFKPNVRAYLSAMNDIEAFQGLPEWLACYVVYGRHSEKADVVKWNSPQDINIYLNNFKQHSLRNPIVESVILETMRVVRDLWARFESFDEIHLEMGRDLKNPSDKRAQATLRILENEKTNIRIKSLLAELANSDVEGVRPNSPSQQDILRIYEDAVLQDNEPDDEIKAIISELSDPTSQPSHSNVIRYKCWLDQKYCSPYTGMPIPLTKLFTTDYEIEHIIPQSRYFDDSFANKVICESEVNKLKDNQLGYEFIKNHHGQTVNLANGKMARILEISSYEEFVKEHYSSRGSSAKRRNLLLDDIPAEFIERQLNDSRYISKVVMSLLSNIVRDKDAEGKIEQEPISKNLIACSGKITDYLKRDWGMGDVWNSIILSRFQRLNSLTGRDCFTTVNTHGKEIPAMPLELSKGFSKKRIDHRHHAMDAIVIACTSREHVNLLNNESAKPENKDMKYALSHKLRRYEEIVINGKKRSVPKEFLMPWPSFKSDVYNSLQDIVVSFKQNLRIINSATNKTMHYENGLKTTFTQSSNEHYAVRKSLHKATGFGRVNLQRIHDVQLKAAIATPDCIVDKRLKAKVKELLSQKYNEKQLLTYFKTFAHEWKDYDFKKVSVRYFTDDVEPMVATRFTNQLVNIFKGKTKEADIKNIIAQITDTGIQKILLDYLSKNKEQIEYAFSPEGLEQMNENISQYNNGHQHKPIITVRMFEALGNKYPVGHTGCKTKKFVVADAGTNLFFAVYENGEGKRKFKTIALNESIERLLQKVSPVPETNEDGDKLLFYLSPNDLVYLPSADELEGNIAISNLDKARIYRFVDSSGTTANFVPCTTANVIYHLKKNIAEKFCKGDVIQDEYGQGSPQSKNQKAITGEMVKELCIPLTVNRIGEIKLK